MASNIFLDIALENDDLLMASGDFKILPSDDQNIGDIVRSYPGEWKQFPEIGAGIGDYLNSSGKSQEAARKITVNLSADGFVVNRPKVIINGSDLTYYPNAYRQ